MEIEEIKIGDVVKLRSGGPEMTIIEKAPDTPSTTLKDSIFYPNYKCKWFDEKEFKYMEEVFNKKLLKKVN